MGQMNENLKELIKMAIQEGKRHKGLTIDIKGEFKVLMGNVHVISLGDNEYAIIPDSKIVILLNRPDEESNRIIYVFTLDTDWVSLELD